MDPQVEAAIIGGCFGIFTVAGTLVTQYLGGRASRHANQVTLETQRKQYEEQLHAQREQAYRTLAEMRAGTLNERFALVAGQLGDDKPAAVRLAGVYAMAGLADDWKENRQICVDVLCGYLRLRHEPGGLSSEVAMNEVHHTVIRVITAHLRDDDATLSAVWSGSWQGLDFDFTGVVFDGGDFSGARFPSGTVSFDGAEFSGGTVSFDGAEFSGGTVSFDGAKFSGGAVDFDHAEFSGGTVSFDGAEFLGSAVTFNNAKFSGGTVDFSGASDWSVPPAFPWKHKPPPGVKLPQKEDQSQA
jgi:hypothetical protein